MKRAKLPVDRGVRGNIECRMRAGYYPRGFFREEENVGEHAD